MPGIRANVVICCSFIYLNSAIATSNLPPCLGAHRRSSGLATNGCRQKVDGFGEHGAHERNAVPGRVEFIRSEAKKVYRRPVVRVIEEGVKADRSPDLANVTEDRGDHEQIVVAVRARIAAGALAEQQHPLSADLIAKALREPAQCWLDGGCSSCAVHASILLAAARCPSAAQSGTGGMRASRRSTSSGSLRLTTFQMSAGSISP